LFKAIVPNRFVYYSVGCFLVATMPDELPSADTVLDSNDIVKYGTLGVSHLLTDRWSPCHDIAGIVYEADDFYDVSHNIVMGCWKHAYMGDVVTMDELLDCVLDMEDYSLLDT
jgi:hypothetical protein